MQRRAFPHACYPASDSVLWWTLRPLSQDLTGHTSNNHRRKKVEIVQDSIKNCEGSEHGSDAGLRSQFLQVFARIFKIRLNSHGLLHLLHGLIFLSLLRQSLSQPPMGLAQSWAFAFRLLRQILAQIFFRNGWIFLICQQGFSGVEVWRKIVRYLRLSATEQVLKWRKLSLGSVALGQQRVGPHARWIHGDAARGIFRCQVVIKPAVLQIKTRRTGQGIVRAWMALHGFHLEEFLVSVALFARRNARLGKVAAYRIKLRNALRQFASFIFISAHHTGRF